MAAIDIPPILVPDDFVVWAASDVHGQVGAVERLLARASLVDEDGRWAAAPRTALVVTGDLVDRGPDSVGLVRRLLALREDAVAAGGLVAICEGNHEAQVLGGLSGEPSLFRALLAFGGGATLLSAGLTTDEWLGDPDADALRARVDALAPDFLPALWSFAPYARWRDVLFVHGGPVPDRPLDAWARGADRLWIRDAFFASPDPFPEGSSWSAFREAGIRRVVFGHTQVEAPALVHGGHGLNIDTGRGGVVTLARVPADGDLAGTTFLSEPSEPWTVPDAPITADEVRHLDATLPASVDAWLERIGTRHPRLGGA